MTDELIGYTDEQHRELSRVVLAARKSELPAAGVRSGTEVYPGVCRVILSESESPVYRPKDVRECGLFQFNPFGQQQTIEFNGYGLEGDLILTVNGIAIQIPCNATTAVLRAKLVEHGIASNDCRATVFAGLWEFDFNGGRFIETPPTLHCEAFEPPPEDVDTPIFSGELRVVQEAWLSVSDDGENVRKVETRDWIPHKAGAIKAGAIGAAVWCHEAGWMVLAWQCRDYSFRAEG